MPYIALNSAEPGIRGLLQGSGVFRECPFLS
jgi:hypothetical protein